MKGLGNYVCLRRFAEHTRQQHLGLGRAPTSWRGVAAFVDESASGDRAELDGGCPRTRRSGGR